MTPAPKHTPGLFGPDGLLVKLNRGAPARHVLGVSVKQGRFRLSIGMIGHGFRYLSPETTAADILSILTQPGFVDAARAEGGQP